MTEEQIKTELYDLQYHTCNGVLTIDKSGHTHIKRNGNCKYCTRIVELKNALFEIQIKRRGVTNET